VKSYELTRGQVKVPSATETENSELNRAVRDAIRTLEDAREATSRPADAKPEPLPPPLPE
jgi:hypothetical protein